VTQTIVEGLDKGWKRVSWGISSSSGLCIKLSQAIGSGIHVASGGFLTERYEFCYAKK
jgi:hypothetical protein